MGRKVLALSGWRFSGKDTTADFLVQEFGFTKLSFAARLKDMVARDYRIPREWMDDPLKKEVPLEQYPVIATDASSAAMQQNLHVELNSGYWTPRALCIHEGTAKRAVHSNYWVRQVAEVISSIPDQDFVISDLRYKSEADTLRLLLPEIQLIRITRFDSILTNDPSERDLDNYTFDWRISNRGTPEELYTSITNLPIISLDDLGDQ